MIVEYENVVVGDFSGRNNHNGFEGNDSSGGSGSGGGSMEERLAKLEGSVAGIVSSLQDVKGDLRELRSEQREDAKAAQGSRESMRSDLLSSITSLRTDLKSDFGEVKSELKADYAGLKDEMKGLKGEVKDVRDDAKTGRRWIVGTTLMVGFGLASVIMGIGSVLIRNIGQLAGAG